MKKSCKKPETIEVSKVLEVLDNEIASYDIREVGAMEKKMVLIKIRKEFLRVFNEAYMEEAMAEA
jgi:hypothetical protein